VFTATSPPRSNPGPLFIVVRANGTAALEQSIGTSGAPALGGIQAASCYQTWAYPVATFFSGTAWARVAAAGWGNHCGYANVPGMPQVQPNCICTGTWYEAGHYDSNYGGYAYNYWAAAGWANIHYSWATVQDTWLCRAYVYPNGGSWGYCW